MLRRHVAYDFDGVQRIYRMILIASEGGPGHGLVHLLSESGAEIGFAWDSMIFGW